MTDISNIGQIIDYTIIVAVYNEEGLITNTFNTLREKVIEKNPDKVAEILFIDDGSKDKSLLELISIKNEYPDLVNIIKLSRNFGQVSAIIAGYNYARGKCIVSISADLQDPPELINQMLEHYFVDGYETVIATRVARDESVMRSITSKIFYSIIKKFSFPNMPQGGFDFFLISSKVRDNIITNNEKNPFIQGQILWAGFNIKFITYKRAKRVSGKSKWTISKKIKYLIDGILSYSYLPLRAMTFLGIVISLAGFIYALVVFIARLAGNVPFKGWAPLMIIMLVLFGIQMIMLGIIGEYLWRTLDQTRNRQQFIVDKKI
ncbi:MAG: glycosyltransferase family 2 protein [Bacteroidales bacterium]|nr:glycosyltransferase family 2 protein [Bacteroidales bacterium]